MKSPRRPQDLSHEELILMLLHRYQFILSYIAVVVTLGLLALFLWR